MVAPGSAPVPGLPEGENVIQEGASVFQGTPALPQVPGEGVLQATPAGSECVRLTHVSGDDGGSKTPMNITQVTFMKPQTQTSEVVEVIVRFFQIHLFIYPHTVCININIA